MPTIKRERLKPPTIGDIADEWWDVILDGRMWRIDGRAIPDANRDDPIWGAAAKLALTQNSCEKMRAALVYRAKKRGLRITAVIRNESLTNPDTAQPERVWCVFVQTAPRTVALKDVRWDRDMARPAPLMAVGVRRRGGSRGKRPDPAQYDMTEVIQRLLAAQTAPSVRPASLVKNLEFNWYALNCTCDTLNIRSHDAHCDIYPVMEMLERVINRQEISPEEWVQRYRQHSVW